MQISTGHAIISTVDALEKLCKTYHFPRPIRLNGKNKYLIPHLPGTTKTSVTIEFGRPSKYNLNDAPEMVQDCTKEQLKGLKRLKKDVDSIYKTLAGIEFSIDASPIDMTLKEFKSFPLFVRVNLHDMERVLEKVDTAMNLIKYAADKQPPVPIIFVYRIGRKYYLEMSWRSAAIRKFGDREFQIIMEAFESKSIKFDEQRDMESVGDWQREIVLEF